ncbi:LysR family transcriptional regulator [Yinghuangia aomiensis]
MRDIEIFLTLADELHFGRTAERLHVSQARISQAIGRQERRLGGQLFDRSNRRRVQLTPLGRQLYDDLRPVYANLRDTLERARLAARGVARVLRIGMIPSNPHYLRDYWQAFRSRHPDCELRFRYAPFTDPFAVLRTGELDVLITWLPVEEEDLTVGPVLFHDPRILAISTDHALAARSSARADMLADVQVTSVQVPGYWGNTLVPTHTPAGHTIERGLPASTMDELMTLITTGEAAHIFPAHAAPYWSRPEIRWVPLGDLENLTFVMVWRTETENDAIRALAQVVQELGPLPAAPE